MTENTFQTTLPPSPRADALIRGLKASTWNAWLPGIGFPRQDGSGYGNYNDAWIPGPSGVYQTDGPLNRYGTRAQTAAKNQGMPGWMVALRTWWKGE